MVLFFSRFACPIFILSLWFICNNFHTLYTFVQRRLKKIINRIINGPSVAKAVLHTPSSLIIWFIHSVIQSSFYSQSSKHHKSQTVRARYLHFWDNVHHPLCVTCHVSNFMCYVSLVMCYLSRVTCHVSHVTFFFCYAMLCYGDNLQAKIK